MARGIKYTDAEIFVKNSPLHRGSGSSRILLRRLLNYRPYMCEICGNTGKWLEKEIRLHVDHVDGDNRNHELENLKLLCPNCHSQTSTYCRNKKLAA